MNIKTSELTGAALDWAVAKCEGYIATFKPDGVVYAHPISGEWHHNGNWSPSTKWVQGGPIIEREGISVRLWIDQGWCATNEREGDECDGDDYVGVSGPTSLVAAMRCYVASKLGFEVDVPEELLK